MTDRKTYLGSSDARELLYGDWRALWALKTGRAEPPDLSDVFRVQLGVHTEDFHLRWIKERVRQDGTDGLWNLNPSWCEGPEPFIGGSPDAIIMIDGKGPGIPVEVKHTGGRKSMDDLLAYYMPQIQWHMLCTSADRCLFSAIMGNNEPERRWVGRSPEWQSHLLDAALAFWPHVVEDREPERTAGQPYELENPAPPAALAPINDMKWRDATGDNEFTAWAVQYADHAEAAALAEEAKKKLKTLVAADEREVVLPGVLSIKRDARRALRITLTPAVATAAE